MDTDYPKDAQARIEHQKLQTSFDGLRTELGSHFDKMNSEIEGKLARQTRELVVWIFATALGTFVCTTGITSVLLKLSLG